MRGDTVPSPMGLPRDRIGYDPLSEKGNARARAKKCRAARL
jgi:hypothetical protein